MIVKLEDFEAEARARLEPQVFDYFAGGAGDERTLESNRAAWHELELHYRVLVDVGRRELATTVLGTPISMPVLVAPMSYQLLAHPSGEGATLRAANAAGIITVMSMGSSVGVEDAVALAPTGMWFQLYVLRDRELTRAIVHRAEAAGCGALVLTVDAPALGRRERDVRSGFELPVGLPVAALPGLTWKAFGQLLDPTLSWRDVAWLKSITRLPVVVKGIVRPDDARAAVDCGVAAIVVSNHGGRQLDGCPATASVLAAVATAVGDRTEVLVDGGIRRGSDVVRALALGARAVLVGRPILWALACDGEQGVARALALLRAELDVTLALCGCPDLGAVGRDLLGR